MAHGPPPIVHRDDLINVLDYLGELDPTASPRRLAPTLPRVNSRLQPRAADGVSLHLGQYLQRVGEPRSASIGGGGGGGAVQRAGAAGFTSGSFELAQHGSTLDIFEHLANLPAEGSVAAGSWSTCGGGRWEAERVDSRLQPRAADGARSDKVAPPFARVGAGAPFRGPLTAGCTCRGVAGRAGVPPGHCQSPQLGI